MPASGDDDRADTWIAELGVNDIDATRRILVAGCANRLRHAPARDAVIGVVNEQVEDPVTAASWRVSETGAPGRGATTAAKEGRMNASRRLKRVRESFIGRKEAEQMPHHQ